MCTPPLIVAYGEGVVVVPVEGLADEGDDLAAGVVYCMPLILATTKPSRRARECCTMQ